MRVVQQKQTLPIQNLDEKTQSLRNGEKRHGDLLPTSIRGIIVGPSNCGKTNVMISLLIDPSGLRFKNIYIFSKSLYQPKYEFLRQVLEPIKEIGYYTFNNNCDIMEPSSAKEHSIFIFDDVMCETQNSIRSYFSMGRHKSVDCFYLAQTYSRIPKQLVRDNANFIIVFKQDEMNLQHIFSDHVCPDMTFPEFKNMCAMCWNDKFGFLVIDKDRDIKCGRYRKRFDSFIYL
jgi:Poxvirus A32 protein